MNSTIATIAVVLAAVALAGAIILLFTKEKKSNAEKRPPRKDRAELAKSAGQKIAQNPKDINALSTLGEIYYEAQDWDKAMGIYKTLSSLASSNPGKIDKFECSLRYGISAMKAGQPAAAAKGLTAARKIKPSSAEANYNLGLLLFSQKEYEKAVPLFRIAVEESPRNKQAQRHLGLSLQRSGHFREALSAIRKVLEAYPDDKDLLFALGECFRATGRTDSALNVFSRLRTDPTLGPQAALYSGSIHAQKGMNDKAAEDFEIGIKHRNAPQDIFLETRYRYAILLMKARDLSRAEDILKEIQKASPGYKDTDVLIARCQELNSSSNLKAYMLAGQGEFTVLCRKVVSKFYANANVQVTEVSEHNDYTDIVMQVETTKWEDIVIFRFLREQGKVGVSFLRDLHGRIKELKAGRAVCFCAGTFSEESKHFIEGRPIDLYNRDALKRILDRLDSA